MLTEKLTDWRKDLEKTCLRGEALEELALQLKFPEGMAFACRPHWEIPTLDWTNFCQELEEFKHRVKLIADHLGRPADKVAAPSYTAYANHAPDLIATWDFPSKEHKKLTVQIRVMSPKGCKVDPRTFYARESYPELHPECKAVLEELEDYGAK